MFDTQLGITGMDAETADRARLVARLIEDISGRLGCPERLACLVPMLQSWDALDSMDPDPLLECCECGAAPDRCEFSVFLGAGSLCRCPARIDMVNWAQTWRHTREGQVPATSR
jgi:hypothetical protein